ncbi:MAG: cupin domain-containing protein, partial [Desulfofundulus sp.]
MKKLITASDVQKAAAGGQKQLTVDSHTLITPAARDTARELGVQFVEDVAATAPGPAVAREDAAGSAPSIQPVPPGPTGAAAGQPGLVEQVCHKVGGGIDVQLVAQVVKEVLAQLGMQAVPAVPLVERDPSGIRLVRGNTVVCQPFDTGKPGDRVALVDLLPLKESPRMAAGFMTMEKSSFDWELRYDEYDYIIEGTLEITVDGRTYTGRAGDVFYIPRGSKITFGCPDRVKFFYVTYPA